MPELIPIRDNDGIQAVMGRDLHAFLEVGRDYTNWFKDMCQYGFTAGQDFTPISAKTSAAGGRPRTDHIIGLDMAKEISMIQRTDRGKQARQYFIECEKRTKRPMAEISRLDLARMLVAAEEEKLAIEAVNKELAPRAASWDALAAPGGDYSVSAAAKVLSRDPRIEIGRNRLFEHMHGMGWIFRTKGKRAHWEASQDKAIKTGRLAHKPGGKFINEKTGEWEQAEPTVRVTPKGLHELHMSLGGIESLQPALGMEV